MKKKWVSFLKQSKFKVLNSYIYFRELTNSSHKSFEFSRAECNNCVVKQPTF